MANTRQWRRPEWANKPIRRGKLRLCPICLRTKPRCYDSQRRVYAPWGLRCALRKYQNSWKNHRAHQWRE